MQQLGNLPDRVRAAESPAGKIPLEKLFSPLAAGCVLAYALGLCLLAYAHAWILGPQGKPVLTDFLEVWVAGNSALKGAAASVYDPSLHHAAQAAVLGHDFNGFLGWHYPPAFLFVAAALACLPYTTAFLTWTATTLGAFALTNAVIAKTRAAIVFALAAPAVFANIIPGQNGFLTAALIGAVLLNLEQRPILSGVFLGLLTYKPQFGVLFPLALLADSRWRALGSALATAILIAVLALLVFGPGSTWGFFHYLPMMSHAVLVQGSAGWGKLQSMYGLARWLGAGNSSAWTVQGLAMLMAGSGVIWLWRQPVPFALKAAALSAAIPLMTPYLYLYDLPMLVVPLAFLHRERPFDRIEIVGILAENLAVAAFVVLKAPVGPFAVAMVCGLIARRLMQKSKGLSKSTLGANELPARC